jgi:GntR family transcriptional regulator / MocR family aminotransferase
MSARQADENQKQGGTPMLWSNFMPDRTRREPLYLQLAHFIMEEIRQSRVLPGTRLPSVRELAAGLGLSRTTTETCYNKLTAEGYLVSKPQSGYFVADLAVRPRTTQSVATARTETPVRYDFANNYVDGTTFPAVIWRRCLGRALHEKATLTGYGEPQGEPALRQALAEYSHEARGVIAQPEQIVISAGVQSLFVLLAALLADRLFRSRKAIAWERPGFAQGEEIFRRQGWDISHFDVENLAGTTARLLYVSPSNPYKGRSLTPEQRRSLLRWTRERDGYILEDDYNGEFRYFATPVSSLQGMGDGEHIVYLGSFSRLLFPSLRISYMVLPPGLLPDYQRLARLYNQTSSTVEQLALASFLREGHLRRHVKKLRRLYRRKGELLQQALATHFGHDVEIRGYESGLHMRIAVASPCDAPALAAKAEAAGVRVRPIPASPDAPGPELLLSFAGIAEEDIDPAVALLRKAWK